jgi:hypothetical protein
MSSREAREGRFHSRESNRQPLLRDLGISPPLSSSLGSSWTNLLEDMKYSIVCMMISGIQVFVCSRLPHKFWSSCSYLIHCRVKVLVLIKWSYRSPELWWLLNPKWLACSEHMLQSCSTHVFLVPIFRSTPNHVPLICRCPYYCVCCIKQEGVIDHIHIFETRIIVLDLHQTNSEWFYSKKLWKVSSLDNITCFGCEWFEIEVLSFWKRPNINLTILVSLPKLLVNRITDLGSYSRFQPFQGPSLRVLRRVKKGNK